MSKTAKAVGGIIIAVVVVGAIWFAAKPQSQNENESIKIGAVLPLTGSIALSGGEQCQAGIMLAVNDINNSGGINGRLLELKIEDSKSSNIEGVSALNSLMNFYNPIAVLSMGSSLTKSLSPLAEQNKIPILATIATAPGITKALSKNNFPHFIYPLAYIKW